MLRWWLVFVLVVGAPTSGAPVWAQAAIPATITDQAQATVSSAERQVGQLAVQRDALVQRYAAETEEIGRLKKQKRSWRTDRQLQDRLAEAKETADQLRTISDRLAIARGRLDQARRALVVAIDAELAGAPVEPRAQQLARLRTQVAPQRRVAHRIVLPDTTINRDADPEELDEQAAAITESEAELQRQVTVLDAQGKELDRVADLRKQHDRAKELDLRDDPAPRRSAQPSSVKGAPAAADTTFGGGSAPESTRAGDPPSSFESDAIAQLAEVVDVSVTNDLSRAQRSGDPGQRAIAAKKARDAVAARLELLHRKRLEIEKLAKDKRTGRSGWNRAD